MELKVQYYGDTPELTKIPKGDWIDLRCADKVNLLGAGLKLIPLGVSIKLPKGYEAHVLPRSSTFRDWGLIQVNSMGVIDETYCGPNDQWFIPMLRLEERPSKYIPKGTRIAQFRIMKKQPSLDFKTVTEQTASNRGGYGSTGVK